MKNVLGLLFGFSVLLGGSLNAEAQDLEKKAQDLRKVYEQKRAELQKNFENSMRKLRSDFGKKFQELQERTERGREEHDEGDNIEKLHQRIDRLEEMVKGLVERLRGRSDRRGEDRRSPRDRNREEEDRREGFERRGDLDPQELRKRMEEFMERGKAFRLPEGLREMFEEEDFEGLSERIEPWLDRLDEGDFEENFEKLGLDLDELRGAIEEQDWKGLAEQMEPLMERFKQEGGKWRERMEKNRKDGNRFEFRFRRDREREEGEDDEETGLKIELERSIQIVPEKRTEKKGECPFQCPAGKEKKDGLKKRLEKILPGNQDTRFSY